MAENGSDTGSGPNPPTTAVPTPRGGGLWSWAPPRPPRFDVLLPPAGAASGPPERTASSPPRRPHLDWLAGLRGHVLPAPPPPGSSAADGEGNPTTSRPNEWLAGLANSLPESVRQFLPSPSNATEAPAPRPPPQPEPNGAPRPTDRLLAAVFGPGAPTEGGRPDAHPRSDAATTMTTTAPAPPAAAAGANTHVLAAPPHVPPRLAEAPAPALAATGQERSSATAADEEPVRLVVPEPPALLLGTLEERTAQVRAGSQQHLLGPGASGVLRTDRRAAFSPLGPDIQRQHPHPRAVAAAGTGAAPHALRVELEERSMVDGVASPSISNGEDAKNATPSSTGSDDPSEIARVLADLLAWKDESIGNSPTAGGDGGGDDGSLGGGDAAPGDGGSRGRRKRTDNSANESNRSSAAGDVLASRVDRENRPRPREPSSPPKAALNRPPGQPKDDRKFEDGAKGASGVTGNRSAACNVLASRVDRENRPRPREPSSPPKAALKRPPGKPKDDGNCKNGIQGGDDVADMSPEAIADLEPILRPMGRCRDGWEKKVYFRCECKVCWKLDRKFKFLCSDYVTKKNRLVPGFVTLADTGLFRAGQKKVLRNHLEKVGEVVPPHLQSKYKRHDAFEGIYDDENDDDDGSLNGDDSA